MALILDAASEFKAQIVTRNNTALESLAGVYGDSYNTLAYRLRALSVGIEQAKARGIEIRRGWLSRQRRYSELMDQIEEEVLRLARLSADTVEAQQAFMVQHGLEHGQRLLETSLGGIPEPVARAGFGFNRVPTGAVENLVGFLSDGSPLAYKFAGMTPDMIAGIRGLITTGLTMGYNPRHIARLLQRQYDGALNNALTTVRTEALRAYRHSSHETYRANHRVMEGWIWNCAKQRRTCAACWGMDGRLFSIEIELVDHPNGRCSPVPVTKPWSQIFPGLDLDGVPDHSIKPWDPEPKFAKLTEADQRHVLGNAKWELWSRGEITLRDLPVLRPSKVWGDCYTPGSIDEVKDNAARRLALS